MKRLLPLLALLTLFSLPGFAQKQKKMLTGFEKYQKTGAVLPELKIVTGKLKTYTNKDIQSKHHLFLILFNPTCSHCIHLTKLICANAGLFKNTKVVFMAPGTMMPYLNGYYEETKINEHPELIVGVDSSFAVDKLYIYDNQTLPQINIYNHKGQLVKVFKGNTPLASLKKYLP